jgi:hypothetical protein
MPNLRSSHCYSAIYLILGHHRYPVKLLSAGSGPFHYYSLYGKKYLENKTSIGGDFSCASVPYMEHYGVASYRHRTHTQGFLA